MHVRIPCVRTHRLHTRPALPHKHISMCKTPEPAAPCRKRPPPREYPYHRAAPAPHVATDRTHTPRGEHSAALHAASHPTAPLTPPPACNRSQQSVRLQPNCHSRVSEKRLASSACCCCGGGMTGAMPMAPAICCCCCKTCCCMSTYGREPLLRRLGETPPRRCVTAPAAASPFAAASPLAAAATWRAAAGQRAAA